MGFFEFQESVWRRVDSFQEENDIQPRTTESEKQMMSGDILRLYRLGWSGSRIVAWLRTFEEVDPRTSESEALSKRSWLESDRFK